MKGNLSQRVKRLEDAYESHRHPGDLLSYASVDKRLIDPRRAITLMAFPKQEGVPLREGRRKSDERVAGDNA